MNFEFVLFARGSRKMDEINENLQEWWQRWNVWPRLDIEHLQPPPLVWDGIGRDVNSSFSPLDPHVIAQD